MRKLFPLEKPRNFLFQRERLTSNWNRINGFSKTKARATEESNKAIDSLLEENPPVSYLRRGRFIHSKETGEISKQITMAFWVGLTLFCLASALLFEIFWIATVVTRLIRSLLKSWFHWLWVVPSFYFWVCVWWVQVSILWGAEFIPKPFIKTLVIYSLFSIGLDLY